MTLKRYTRGLALMFPFILILALTSGCSHIPGMNKLLGGHDVGSFSQEEVEAFMVKGKTTQDEVRAKFGNPTSTAESKNGSSWLYSTVEQDVQAAKMATNAATAAAVGSAVGGASSGTVTAATAAVGVVPVVSNPFSGESTRLSITFNRAKIVTNYNWSRTTK